MNRYCGFLKYYSKRYLNYLETERYKNVNQKKEDK